MFELRTERTIDAPAIMDVAELLRLDATRQLDAKTKRVLGQFLTPTPVASFMASLFDPAGLDQPIHFLDAGAGAGTLTAAFIDRIVSTGLPPAAVAATLYEVDPQLAPYLEEMLDACKEQCEGVGLTFEGELLSRDFITDGADVLSGSMFAVGGNRPYSHAILNPPYKKLHSASPHRQQLSQVGIEATNLYSAFLALAVHLLQPNGELVAIIPRSFCNGLYFKPFRELFASEMNLRRIHLFDSRMEAFQDDGVLQENIILHAVKNGETKPILISRSSDSTLGDMTLIEREAQQVVNPDDPQMFWHLAVTSLDQHVVDRMRLFPAALADLGIDVSTGPVVDFRLKEQLLDDVTMGVPLIYPLHFNGGFVEWPNLSGRKANAIQQNETTAKWLYPSGTYTLVRRFSSKEEPRRIVATVCELDQGDAIGFENHVNLFHSNKQGLDPTIGRGLAVYLNSTLVDSYLRLFNGHTQVNVTDLRSLPYPPLRVLMEWGSLVDGTDFPPQEQIDDLVEGLLNTMTDISATDPVQAQGKINEALQILVELGLPRAQQNERSALTLLALLNLKPQMSWSESEAPLVGITPIMDFCKAFYGRHYAPNTRETFRRQTIHQFVAVALVVENPDQPDRPKNSPHWAYQIEPAALALLKSFGSDEWAERLADYQADVESLKDRYARARQMQLVPVTLSSGQQVDLSAGEHSELIKAIVEEFAPRFAPAGEVLYLGDTGAKADYFDEDGFANLGITLHKRGKMPDVVIYYRAIGLLTKA